VTKKKFIVVAIIPARGGSKGVPRKNIKELNGKPLISYTIESAIASDMFDRIIVSTDDDEIAEIAARYSEVLVCLRPAELSTDTATTESALIHACDYLASTEKINADFVLTLEPTSPFRTPATIKKAVELLSRDCFDSVVAVTDVTSVLARVKEERFSHVFPNQPRRRQEREALYEESSTIYATALQALRKNKLVIGESPAALVVAKNEAFDINDEFDFQLADLIMQFRDQ